MTTKIYIQLTDETYDELIHIHENLMVNMSKNCYDRLNHCKLFFNLTSTGISHPINLYPRCLK